MHTERLEAIIDEHHSLERKKKAINKRIAELDREYIVYGAKFGIGDHVKDDLGRVFKVVHHKIKPSAIYPTRLLIVYGCKIIDDKGELTGNIESFNDYELTNGAFFV